MQPDSKYHDSQQNLLINGRIRGGINNLSFSYQTRWNVLEGEISNEHDISRKEAVSSTIGDVNERRSYLLCTVKLKELFIKHFSM